MKYCNTEYPKETIEIIIAANQIIYNWGIMRPTPEELSARAAAFIRLMELGLGAPEGSFNVLYDGDPRKS